MAGKRLSLRFALALMTVGLLQGAAANAQRANPETKPSGSIAGRVTMRGKPVAGVSVVAIAGETYNRREAAGRAITDGEGFYRITQLPPGQYQVWALSPTSLPEPPTVGDYSPYGSLKSVLLAAYEDVENVDLKLIPGGVVTGRITDADNKPVAEERIVLEVVDANGNSRSSFPAGNNDLNRTDDRGIYRIYGLFPGHYKVSVGYDPSEGLRGSTYPRTYYSEPLDPAKAAIVELKEGAEVSRIDIKVGSPLPTFAVSGRIIDTNTSQPVAAVGFRISLLEKEPGRTPSFVGQSADGGGEFRFEGLRAGKYSITATSEYYGGNFYGDPVQFEIVDQDVTGIQLKATPGHSISGSVLAEGFTLRDLAALFPDFRVYARSESGKPGEAAGGGTSPISPDGSFQINGLRPGKITFDVYSMSRGTRPTLARVERDGVIIGQGFELQRSTSGVVLVLEHGSGTIRGSVRFAGGGSLPPNARMYVSYKRDGTAQGIGVQTDVRGSFQIKNLMPGAYEVTLQVMVPMRDRSQRPPLPQKQIVNVANGSEAEVIFLIDLGQPRVSP